MQIVSLVHDMFLDMCVVSIHKAWPPFLPSSATKNTFISIFLNTSFDILSLSSLPGSKSTVVRKRHRPMRDPYDSEFSKMRRCHSIDRIRPHHYFRTGIWLIWAEAAARCSIQWLYHISVNINPQFMKLQKYIICLLSSTRQNSELKSKLL